MKKIAGFFLLISQLAAAQQMLKEDLLAGVADKICGYYLSNPPEKVTNNLLGIYMLNAISEHKENLIFYYGKDFFTNDETMVKLGEEIGLYIALKCPNIFSSFIEEDATYNTPQLIQLSGKIAAIKKEQFLSFRLTEVSGKTTEFLLLYDFSSSYLLTDGLIKENDIIDLSYYKEALFDAKIGKFVNFNIVTDLIKK